MEILADDEFGPPLIIDVHKVQKIKTQMDSQLTFSNKMNMMVTRKCLMMMENGKLVDF